MKLGSFMIPLKSNGEWMHTSSSENVKAKQILTPRKVMCTVFFGQTRHFTDWFCAAKVKQSIKMFIWLEKLRRAIQNKRRGMLTRFSYKTKSDHTLRMWQKHSYWALAGKFLAILRTAPTSVLTTFVCFCIRSFFSAVYSHVFVFNSDKESKIMGNMSQNSVKVVDFCKINFFAVSLLFLFLLQNGIYFPDVDTFK